MASAERAFQRNARSARSGDKESIRLCNALERIIAALDSGTPVRALSFDEAELDAIKQFHFITAKPTMYVANVKEDGFSDNPRSEEHTSELQSRENLVCRLLL